MTDEVLKQAAMDAVKKATTKFTEEPTGQDVNNNPISQDTPTSQDMTASFDDEEEMGVNLGIYDDELPMSDLPEFKHDDETELKASASDKTSDNVSKFDKNNIDLSADSINSVGPSKMELNADDLKAYVPTGKEEGFESYSGPLALELNEYAKELVKEWGMSPAEALQARDSKAKMRIIEEREKFLKDNPNIGVIKIRKGDESKLGLTDEEHSKLSRLKEIRLIEIEDEILKTIPIMAVSPSNKREMLDKITGIYCEDKTPLPSTCDYATFRGMQVFELLQAYHKPDDTLEDIISRKAQVLYESFQGSVMLKKYDENKNIILSYDDFIRNVSFFDLDFGLFSVICASSKDVTEGEVRCPRCQRFTKIKYNVRNVMKLDGLPDIWKKKIDDILEYRTDSDKLKSLRDKLHNGVRMQSRVSNNVYDLKIPSISKALNVTHFINKDATQEDLSFFTKAMFVNSMHVYDPETKSYIQIYNDEQALLLDRFRKVPQDDVDAIDIMVQNCPYYPQWEHELHCDIDDKCHHKWNNPFDIEDLVFLRGHDTPVVTV